MENIVFLDIDGVLNVDSNDLSLVSIEVLKELVFKYNAKIVMITSRQGNGTENKRNKIRCLFENLGFNNIDFIDPNYEGNLFDIKLPARLLGIIDYLKKNPFSNYVILDDDYNNDYKIISLNGYRILPSKGLKNDDLNKITFKHVNLDNFKYINYQYRQLGEYELVTNNLIRVLKRIYEKDVKCDKKF